MSPVLPGPYGAHGADDRVVPLLAALGDHTPVQVGAELAAAAVLALVAALLVSVEVALPRTARSAVNQLVREGRAGAAQLAAVAQDPVRYLNMVLLLRTGAEMLAALFLVVAVIGWLGFGWPAITLAAVVIIVADYTLVGVTSRILGRQFPETVALAGATVIHPVTKVLGPLAQLLVVLGRALTPKGRGDREGPFVSEDELRRLIDLAEERDQIDPEERAMIQSVFELDDTRVREVMVPRTDIVFLDRDTSVADGLAQALRSGYSRIPVTGENTDDVVGIVYLKDMVADIYQRWRDEGDGDAERAGRAEWPRTVGDVMRAASYVPDSKPIGELLREMQVQRTHVAIVIDEYGGTAGLVTIEDIVEEIVGEITDEYDDEIPPIEWLADGRARVTARLPIAELAEAFDVAIDTDEVADVGTVGGLLAYALGEVPVSGSSAYYAGLELTAENLSRRRGRPATILVRRAGSPATEPEPAAPER